LRRRSLVLASNGIRWLFRCFLSSHVQVAGPAGGCTGVAGRCRWSWAFLNSPPLRRGLLAGEPESEWISLLVEHVYFPPSAIFFCHPPPPAARGRTACLALEKTWDRMPCCAGLLWNYEAPVCLLAILPLGRPKQECGAKGMMLQFREQKQRLGDPQACRHAVCVHMPRPGYLTWHRRRSGLAGHVQTQERCRHRNGPIISR
jgi:hypothetical protein